MIYVILMYNNLDSHDLLI